MADRRRPVAFLRRQAERAGDPRRPGSPADRSGLHRWRPLRTRASQLPEIVIRAVRNVGDATEVISRRSLAIPSMPLSIASSVEEMVISLTGNANLPFSIQNPAAPREKSEVIALKPKPIISVTYRPLGVLAISSSRLIEPAFMNKLLVDAETLPPPRAAEPVDARPSFRALYESSKNVFSTPPSTTRFLREGRPSPSNGREPGARGISGSSISVTPELATSVPSRDTR